MSIVSYVVDQFQHNQFVSAAIIAAPATAVGYSLRTLPKKTFTFAKKWVTLDIRLNNDMPSYDEALRFITKEVIIDRFTRNYNFQSESKWDWENEASEISNRSMAVGYGTHLGKFRGRLCVITRSIEEGSNTSKFKESTTVTIVAKSKRFIDDFSTAIEEFAGRMRDGQERVSLKVNSGTYWSPAGKLPLRPLNTVFSANDAAQRVVDHITAFDAKRDWNHAKGLPHHTGVLLYGPPGTGKSSLIHAVASATKRTLHYLSLASVEKDKELTELLGGNTDWSKILLVIEDFDGHGITLNRDEDEDTDEDGGTDEDGAPKAVKAKKEPVSLSTILNVLDGLLSPDGLAVIATTNHPERLDEALRRPGRFDLQIELGHIGRPEFEKMAALFEIDPSTYTLPTFEPMSGAVMRSLLLDGGVAAIEAHQMALAA